MKYYYYPVVLLGLRDGRVAGSVSIDLQQVLIAATSYEEAIGIATFDLERQFPNYADNDRHCKVMNVPVELVELEDKSQVEDDK